MARRKIIAGNWKMNMTGREAVDFAEKFKELYKDTDVRTAICAPYVHLELLKEAFDGTDIKVGAQNVHFEDAGAFTGEISAKMLEEIGVDYCIVGHSERRQYFGETDETVNLKLKKLFTTSILPILCVGEDLDQRDSGQALEVVEAQVRRDLAEIGAEDAAKLTIAYEPVWAIGTGNNATPLEANQACEHIRDWVREKYGARLARGVSILYGGSLNDKNASSLFSMPDIDGGLIGGASLIPDKFEKITKEANI